MNIHRSFSGPPCMCLDIGGGGGGGGQSSTSKSNEKLNNKILKAQLKASKTDTKFDDVIAGAIMPKPEKIAPAPSPGNQDAYFSANEARRAAARRKGIRSTQLGGGSASKSTLGAA